MEVRLLIALCKPQITMDICECDRHHHSLHQHHRQHHHHHHYHGCGLGPKAFAQMQMSFPIIWQCLQKPWILRLGVSSVGRVIRLVSDVCPGGRREGTVYVLVMLYSPLPGWRWRFKVK